MTAPMYWAIALNTNSASGEAVLKKLARGDSSAVEAALVFSRRVRGRCGKSPATTVEIGTIQPVNGQFVHVCTAHIHV